MIPLELSNPRLLSNPTKTMEIKTKVAATSTIILLTFLSRKLHSKMSLLRLKAAGMTNKREGPRCQKNQNCNIDIPAVADGIDYLVSILEKTPSQGTHRQDRQLQIFQSNNEYKRRLSNSKLSVNFFVAL